MKTFCCVLFAVSSGGTWYTTYTRVPFYMTNYRRALVVESLDYLVYDMTSPNMVTMDINSTSLIARIISGINSTIVPVYH